MISQDQTDLYLKDFESLAEALYFCWYNSFSTTTKQIDKHKLKEQILSYGLYPHKEVIRENIPLRFSNRLKFNTLKWANNYTELIAEHSIDESFDPHKKAIAEIRKNLFTLSNRTDKIAYANLILCDIDKSNIHDQEVTYEVKSFRFKELFTYVLDFNLISENFEKDNYNYKKVCPINDLTVRLINHFDFIDKLIEQFHCFGIDLASMNEKAHFNLFIFDEKYYLNKTETKNLEPISVPKFESPLSDECLIKIMFYLKSQNWLINSNVENWLYLFDRAQLLGKFELIWDGSPTMLTNIIQHLSIKPSAIAQKTAFGSKNYVKPTRRDYIKGSTYKKIEQIITICSKKNT